MTRYLAFPFRGAALALVLTFTVGLALAMQAGLTGIPLALLLLSWFFKYCFILLDAVVAGDEEPPVLSIEMVNPISELRPLAQALLIAAGVMLVVTLGKFAGPPLAWLCGALLILTLPASIAVLGVSGNPFRAAWPPALYALIRGVGRGYLLLICVTLGAAVLIYWMARYGVPDYVLIAGAQMLLLLTFALVGGMMHEHRLELGIDTRTRQERLAERDEREHVSERNGMLDRAYMKFRVSKPLEGWQEIQAWLTTHGRSEDPGDKVLLEQRAVLEAASQWDDVRPADRLADDLIALFLARRETGRALEVLEERLASNPKYRPTQATHVVRLAELATAAGKRSLRRRLDVGPD
jgi:hypothetical protein